MVAKASDVLGELQGVVARNLVSPKVSVFCLKAWYRLRLLVILLNCKTYCVLILYPSLLAGIGISTVVPSKSDLTKS